MMSNLSITIPAVFGGDLELHEGEMKRSIQLARAPYIGMKLLFRSMERFREDSQPIEILDLIFDVDNDTYIVTTSKIRIPEKYLDICEGWEHKYLC